MVASGRRRNLKIARPRWGPRSGCFSECLFGLRCQYRESFLFVNGKVRKNLARVKTVLSELERAKGAGSEA